MLTGSAKRSVQRGSFLHTETMKRLRLCIISRSRLRWDGIGLLGIQINPLNGVFLANQTADVFDIVFQQKLCTVLGFLQKSSVIFCRFLKKLLCLLKSQCFIFGGRQGNRNSISFYIDF